jgi:hypothetical protein
MRAEPGGPNLGGGPPVDGRAAQVLRSAYCLYGDKAEGLWTGPDGRADFLADARTVSIWLEDGVGLL